MEFFQFHIRQHANVHRVFHIDAAADAAGHIHIIDAFHGHIHTLQQNINSGKYRALGPDEIVDIHFVDGYFPAGFRFFRQCQHITAHAVLIPDNPLALPLELAPGIDDAAAVEF